MARICRDKKSVCSRIGRMVVVRERHGYCWCIPIRTYNYQGVAKKGLSTQDRSPLCHLHGRFHWLLAQRSNGLLTPFIASMHQNSAMCPSNLEDTLKHSALQLSTESALKPPTTYGHRANQRISYPYCFSAFCRLANSRTSPCWT